MGAKHITEKELPNRVYEVHHGKVLYVSGYTDTQHKCLWTCADCKNFWETTPNAVLDGTSCPECAKKKRREHNTKPLPEILSRVKSIWGDSIIYVAGYVNTKTKCTWKCECGNTWDAKPNSILNGYGCRKCGYKRVALKNTLTLTEVLERLQEIYGEEFILDKSTFINITTKARFICKKHGECWRLPSNVLRGCGCRQCSKENFLKKAIIPANIISSRVKSIYGDKICLDESTYINTHKKARFICKEHGAFFATPHNVLQGHTCKKCAVSSMENPVIKLLDEKKIKYMHDTPLKGCVFCKNELRPDFLIENNKGKLWIECDGIQHHIPVFGKENLIQTQARDVYKNKYSKKHGYILLRVTAFLDKRYGSTNQVTLPQLINLLKVGINEKTKEIDFELFRKYDFNRI
jgi:hypothetical protein